MKLNEPPVPAGWLFSGRVQQKKVMTHSALSHQSPGLLRIDHEFFRDQEIFSGFFS
jgi:hypothetical protein